MPGLVLIKPCLIPFPTANCAEVAEVETVFGRLPNGEAESRCKIPANTGFTGTAVDLAVRDADLLRTCFRGFLSSGGVAVALRYTADSETYG